MRVKIFPLVIYPGAATLFGLLFWSPFMFVTVNWPNLVQYLLWDYTASCNQYSVYFVITLSIGTYWNKFPIHTLYTKYIYLIIKSQTFSKAKFIQQFIPTCEDCYVLLMYISMCKLLVFNNRIFYCQK
jgi:hypothetical protein